MIYTVEESCFASSRFCQRNMDLPCFQPQFKVGNSRYYEYAVQLARQVLINKLILIYHKQYNSRTIVCVLSEIHKRTTRPHLAQIPSRFHWYCNTVTQKVHCFEFKRSNCSTVLTKTFAVSILINVHGHWIGPVRKAICSFVFLNFNVLLLFPFILS